MAIKFLVLAALVSSACMQAPAGIQTVSTQTQRSAPANIRVVNAENYPGADVGAKINAADAALGANAGEIRVSSGGNIATQINISSRHTLRIVKGRYSATTNSSVVRLKDYSSLECNDWDSVLSESTGKAGHSSPFSIVRDYNGDVSNYAQSENISINGCHFKGARSDFNSIPQTIGLGNCRNCKVTNNWLEDTRTIGIQAGGGSSEGKYSSNVLIARNLLTGVASQNIAVTNGENVVVEHNTIRKPGQVGGPGVSVIDIEPNTGDRLKNIRISKNNIDATLSTSFAVMHGIAVQNFDTKDYGPVEVVNNKIVGATHSTPKHDYISYAGIVINNAPNVRIRNNYIQRTPWGIKINPGSDRFILNGNELASTGSGSTYAISIVDVSDGLVVNNYLREGAGDMVSLGITAVQIVENTFGGRMVGNIYANNVGAVYQLISSRPDSSPNAVRLSREFGVSFSNLSAIEHLSSVYCSDCQSSAVCAGGGTGRWAKSQNGAWRCN